MSGLPRKQREGQTAQLKKQHTQKAPGVIMAGIASHSQQPQEPRKELCAHSRGMRWDSRCQPVPALQTEGAAGHWKGALPPHQTGSKLRVPVIPQEYGT